MRNNIILISIMIAFVTFSFGCKEENSISCDGCMPICTSHDDCENNTICTIFEEGQEGNCDYNDCLDADCGLGTCTYFPFRCKCNPGAVHNENIDDGIYGLGQCVLNYCEQDKDCYPNGIPEAFFGDDKKRLTICGSDYKCHHSCDDPDFPGCMNAGEICQDDQCVPSTKPIACDSNESCSDGFNCTNDNLCFTECNVDSDCATASFKKGDYCHPELKRCLPKFYESKSILDAMLLYYTPDITLPAETNNERFIYKELGVTVEGFPMNYQHYEIVLPVTIEPQQIESNEAFQTLIASLKTESEAFLTAQFPETPFKVMKIEGGGGAINPDLNMPVDKNLSIPDKKWYEFELTYTQNQESIPGIYTFFVMFTYTADQKIFKVTSGYRYNEIKYSDPLFIAELEDAQKEIKKLLENGGYTVNSISYYGDFNFDNQYEIYFRLNIMDEQNIPEYKSLRYNDYDHQLSTLEALFFN